MNYAGNIEIVRKHFHDHRENLCIAVLSTIPLRQTFFFKQRLFLFKGALKNIQGLLWKIQGLFKDIPQFFNFQGLFKPRANHVNTLDSRILEPSQTRTSR